MTFKIIHLTETESTNSHLENLSDSGELNEGTVVYTDRQSSGKGQGLNKWESEAYKNLTMSLALKPTFLKANQQFYLNKAISLAVCDTIDFYTNQKSQIKWPNDIYVGNKKISGILIEHIIMGDHIFESIIGIGINVNQTLFISNAPNPISIQQITEKDNKIEDVLNELLKNINTRYQSLRTNIKSQCEEYQTRSFGLNEWRNFIFKEKNIEGQISGVNEYGQLIIKGNNHEWICNQQEIKFIL